MEISNEYHLSPLKVLLAFSFICFGNLASGGPYNFAGQSYFEKLPVSKCFPNLKQRVVKPVASIIECASHCLQKKYSFFSYCDEECKLYEKEKGEIKMGSESCSCTLYFKLQSDGPENYVNIFEIEGGGFLKNPLYLYWDSLPIKEVRLSLRDNSSVVRRLSFNGTGSNLSSWFQEDKVIFSGQWTFQGQAEFFFNNYFSQPCFEIKAKSSTSTLWLQVCNNIMKYSNGTAATVRSALIVGNRTDLRKYCRLLSCDENESNKLPRKWYH